MEGEFAMKYLIKSLTMKFFIELPLSASEGEGSLAWISDKVKFVAKFDRK